MIHTYWVKKSFDADHLVGMIRLIRFKRGWSEYDYLCFPHVMMTVLYVVHKCFEPWLPEVGST